LDIDLQQSTLAQKSDENVYSHARKLVDKIQVALKKAKRRSAVYVEIGSNRYNLSTFLNLPIDGVLEKTGNLKGFQNEGRGCKEGQNMISSRDFKKHVDRAEKFQKELALCKIKTKLALSQKKVTVEKLEAMQQKMPFKIRGLLGEIDKAFACIQIAVEMRLGTFRAPALFLDPRLCVLSISSLE
jgi:hypothetical protein